MRVIGERTWRSRAWWSAHGGDAGWSGTFRASVRVHPRSVLNGLPSGGTRCLRWHGTPARVVRRVLAVVLLAVCALACASDPGPADAGACTGDRLVCDGACVDPDTDTRNCGRCGRACAPNEACSAGRCAGCVTGTVACEGRCDRSCAGSEQCVEGRCSPCGVEVPMCDGRCVDLTSDTSHCGACGRPCGGDMIRRGGNGIACPAGRAACNGECVDLDTDANACGACGVLCPASQLCEAGRCANTCRPGAAERDGRTETVRETALDADNAHCGACGAACAAGSLAARSTFTSAARPSRWRGARVSCPSR